MPRLSKRLPSYRNHKASGQAIVTLDGRDFYLGPYGTQVSKAEYDRLVGEWLNSGRRLPESSSRGVTMEDLLAAFWLHADKYYVDRQSYVREQADIFTFGARRAHPSSLVSALFPDWTWEAPVQGIGKAVRIDVWQGLLQEARRLERPIRRQLTSPTPIFYPLSISSDPRGSLSK